MKLSINPSSTETIHALIFRVIEIMNEEPERDFNIALSGGRTAAMLFDLWANEFFDATPWGRMRIFWVDERCVPFRNSESNFGMTHTLLLSMVPIFRKNVFPIQGFSKSPQKEAKRYSTLVKEQVPQKNGWPEFDIILLGVGYDGHTSSIFPGQEALLTNSEVFAIATQPSYGQKRITMTGQAILNARHILFLVTEKEKAPAVAGMFDAEFTSPAAYIAYHAKDAQLFVDESATTCFPSEL